MAKRTPSKSARKKPSEVRPEGAAVEGDHLPPGEAMTDLAQILGQPRAVDTLNRAMSSGRLHHAWLFSGPMGVGKRSAAEALSAMALDPTLDRGLTGGVAAAEGSRVSGLARSRSHPDIRLVNKELSRFSEKQSVRGQKQRNIPVEVVRERVVNPAGLAPAESPEGGWGGSLARKSIIIDEAELLDDTAQNTLLKTLEEPPEGTMLILVTSRERRLLPTVRSRCHRVGFGPLGREAMGSWVSSRGFDLSAEDRDWLLWFSDGSPGRFSRAVETGIAAWRGALEPGLDELERGGFPAWLAPAMAEAVDGWAKAWVKTRPLASKEAANQAAMGEVLTLVSLRARDRLRSGDAAGARRAAGVIEAVRRAEEAAARSVNLSFVFEELAGALAS